MAGGASKGPDVKRYTDFMCVCRDESKAKCDALMERVYKNLRCGPEEFLSYVVFSLEWDLDPDGEQSQEFTGTIDSLISDQWFGVGATVQKAQDGKLKDFAHIFVQCDKLEHGIARVWELAKEACTEG